MVMRRRAVRPRLRLKGYRKTCHHPNSSSNTCWMIQSVTPSRSRGQQFIVMNWHRGLRSNRMQHNIVLKSRKRRPISCWQKSYFRNCSVEFPDTERNPMWLWSRMKAPSAPVFCSRGWRQIRFDVYVVSMIPSGTVLDMLSRRASLASSDDLPYVGARHRYAHGGRAMLRRPAISDLLRPEPRSLRTWSACKAAVMCLPRRLPFCRAWASPCTNTLAQNLALELGEHSQQCGHGAAGRHGQVQRLGQRHEADTEVFQLLQSGKQVGYRSSPAVRPPYQYYIDFTATRSFYQLLAPLPL